MKIRKEELKMLWMDYYFYLSKLPEEERRNQYLRKRNEEACFKNVENYKKIIQMGDNNG